MSDETKRCPMCERTLPLSEFPPDKSRKDGRYGYCRPCKRDYERAYIKARRERAKRLRVEGEGE